MHVLRGLNTLRELEDIENKLLHLDSVRFCRFYRFTRLAAKRDFLLGKMVHELVLFLAEIIQGDDKVNAFTYRYM